MRNLIKISQNVYALRFPNSPNQASALVTIGNTTTDAAYSGSSAGFGFGLKGTFIPRGQKDTLLFDFHRLVTESPNKLRLIKTRRDFVIGLGVYTYKKALDPLTKKSIEEEVFNPAFDAFSDRISFEDVIAQAGIQQSFANDVFVKMTLGLDGKIESYQVIDCFQIRIRRPFTGETKIMEYIINPNFGTTRYRSADNVNYPAFEEKEPIKFPVAIIHLRDKLPGQEFYQIADWWGTADWTKVANKVPKFHDSGLDNGYNIKYHISIPDNYFQKEGLNEDEQEKLKEDTLNAMGDSLSGIENVDKVLYTFHGVDGQGREMGGVKITPLANPMSDDAYTALFHTANIAQASGHGVLPTLAGIDTGGKLGGSGKELEVAANYQQGFMTHNDRRLLLKLATIANKIEGFDPTIKFGFRNIQLYTPDVTPVAAGANPN